MSIISIQVNPRCYKCEVTSYYLNDEFNGKGETTIESVIESLSNNNQEIVIVDEENGTLTGFICIQLKKSYCYDEYTAEITEVYVRPEYRNKGIAGSMITFAENHCSEQLKLHKFELLTGTENIAAQTLYKKLGFREDGEMHLSKRINSSALSSDKLAPEIIFVTHNQGKIASAKKELADIDFKIYEYDIEEPRSDDIVFISKYKVEKAYQLTGKPCISMDSGFWIDALNGFPRAFVNFTLDTIGVKGILKLMEGQQNRNCRFTECLSYYDGTKLHQFMGYHEGTLSEQMLGTDSDKKWSDLWYVYIPCGYDRTLAQMTDEEVQNRIRYKSVSSLAEFAKWYREQKEEKNK